MYLSIGSVSEDLGRVQCRHVVDTSFERSSCLVVGADRLGGIGERGV